MVMFGLYNASTHVSQVFNSFILIIWIQLNVVGLRMLSAYFYPSLLHPNLFVRKLQIAVLEELLAAHNR